MNPLRLVTPDTSSNRPAMLTAEATYSREHLMGRAAAVAERLRGITAPRDRVVVSLKNTPHFFSGLAGAWLADAVPVLLDPMVKLELASAAELTGARAVVWHGRDDIALPDGLGEVIPDDRTADVLSSPDMDDGEPVLYLFTSGSTGKPTLVPKTYAQIRVEVDFITALFDGPHGVATLVPWCHIWGLLSAFFVPLASGATCDLTAGVSALTVLKRTAAGQVSLVTAVPAYYQAMVRLLRAGAAPAPASTCRFGCSSAPLSPALRAEFTELSGCGITDIFGSTEAGGIAYRRVDGPWTVEPHVEIRVDEDGLLEVRSPSVSFEDEDGFFRTGDMVRPENGGFVLIGRSDDVVKIGGRRIALGEVQTVVEACPDVLRAAVLAEEVRGALRLTAYVEPQRAGVNAETIKRYVRARLADHKVPRVIHLLDTLPLTSSGKVDRQNLRQLSDPKEP